MARLAVIGSLVAAALIALGPPARAGTADEVVGLFTEACLPFAGTPARLRDWAARNALTDMPDPARTAFLNGAAGKVFDASSSGGKFVLLSSDDGLCAAIAQQAKGADVVAALEQELGKAGVVRTPINIEGHAPGIRRGVPGLGEHADEILAEAGLSSEEIAALRAKEVLGE